jgi:hypothetical protein
MNVDGTMNATNMDFLLASTRLCDVVGGLHSHERIHLHAEGLLDAEGHLARGLSIEQTGQGRAGNPERDGGGGNGQARGYNDLRPDEVDAADF